MPHIIVVTIMGIEPMIFRFEGDCSAAELYHRPIRKCTFSGCRYLLDTEMPHSLADLPYEGYYRCSETHGQD